MQICTGFLAYALESTNIYSKNYRTTYDSWKEIERKFGCNCAPLSDVRQLMRNEHRMSKLV